MDDAVDATIAIMNANAENLTIWSSYNLAAISFTPSELAKSIQNVIPEFKITYAPDFRQKIADSWPKSIDDSQARKDWGWEHSFDLKKITEEMLTQLQKTTTT